MKEKWMVMAKRAPFYQIAEKFQIDPLTARIIRNRDIEGDEAIERYLRCSLEDIPDERLLSGIEKAAALLAEKIAEGVKIRVIGDYDIDGICATFILVKGLGLLGGNVDFAIPERIKDGYGLNIRLVEEALSDGVDTIVTCDNGISAVDQILFAKQAGMSVVITDHHEVPYEEKDEERRYLIPPADAVIDPKQPGETYPFRDICGAVVAWKLIRFLFSRIRGSNEGADRFLPYAAFATVGDVMDLRDENRIIVRRGLEVLGKDADPGMRSLIRACGLEDKNLSAYHIGFVLGPCINASGRLETAMKAMELLLCDDPFRAAILADELVRLNEERKVLTEQGLTEAMAMLENHMAGDKVYVLLLPDCHESIAGIIAGKVRERSAHPVYILTRSAQDGLVKGSGRSIPAYSMFDALLSCRELLEKFGGHPMAAGVTMKEENVEAFRKRLNETCTLQEEDFTEKILVDAAMPLGYISRPLIEELALLEPYGKGNEKPVFAQKNLVLHRARVMGKNRNVLKLRVQDEDGCAMDALYYGDVEQWFQYISSKYGQQQLRLLMAGRENQIRLSVVYYPQVNSFRGEISLQIVISHYK